MQREKSLCHWGNKCSKTLENRLQMNKNRSIKERVSIRGFPDHVKDFGLYPRKNREPLKKLQMRTDKVRLTCRKVVLDPTQEMELVPQGSPPTLIPFHLPKAHGEADTLFQTRDNLK